MSPLRLGLPEGWSVSPLRLGLPEAGLCPLRLSLLGGRAVSALRMGLPEDGAVSPQIESFLTTGFRCHLPAPVEVLQILLTSAPPLPQSNTQTTRPLACPHLVFMEAILCQALGGGTDGGTREHKDAGRAPA